MSKVINGELILEECERWLWCPVCGESTVWRWNGEAWVCVECERRANER